MSSNNEELCFNCGDRLSECECGETETFSEIGGPLCPYCGHLNRASDSDGLLYREESERYDCGSCEKEFRVAVCVSFVWTAAKA